MNDSRRAAKVGLFVFITLALIAALLIQFSKSGTLFRPTYRIRMEVANAAGLKEGASVLMAGVGIGTVETIELPPGGRKVILHLKIDEKYTVYKDSSFFLEPAGFLGDLYVAVEPKENKAAPVKDGETVFGAEALNIQEVARSAAGLIQRVDQAVAKLDEAITRVDSTVLSQQTLTNLTYAVANFRLMSDRGLTAMDTVERALRTNAPAIGDSVSNFVAFSHELRNVSGEFHLLVLSNRAPLFNAISNIEMATVQVNDVLTGVREGKGLAGQLLSSESLAQSFASLISHADLFASNATIASSNLNKRGLFRFLLKPKEP